MSSAGKPRPRQTGQLHRIAALGYHPSGKAVSSSADLRTVRDSQGNVIPAPRHRRWNGTGVEVLIDATTRKGKNKAVEPEEEMDVEEEGSGPTASPRRSPRRRKGVSPPRERPTSKQNRQFIDCVLLPSRLKPPPAAAEEPQSSTEADSLPDSELLKLIHYHASTYYESRGQLRDRSELLSQVLHAGDSLREAKRDHAEGKAPKPSRQRAERATKTKTMHAALGGDVLVALGILLEEEINHQLEPSALPEGWDEMEVVGDEAYPLEDDWEVEVESGAPRSGSVRQTRSMTTNQQ